jgi:tetrahydromethanopterin S-methyltransferase subunit B
MTQNSLDLLKEINNSVNRLEDKLDRRINSLENRITTLEAFQNKALGVLIIASSVFTLILNAAWERFK